MGHLYEVHTSDGRSHPVETHLHHEGHDERTFANHLLDVLKGASSSVLGNVIVHRFIYRGRR